MKIAIDIRNIGKGRTGSEAVFFELVKNLTQIDDMNEYHLLIDDREHDVIERIGNQLGIVNRENFTVVQLGSGNKFMWNGWKVAKYCAKEKIDIYHTQYIIPFFVTTHTKIVTHIHDVSFRVHKELITKTDAFFLNILIPHAVKKSDRVIAVSQFTKDEIVKYYKIDPEKVAVIYNAVGMRQTRNNGETVRKKYHLPEKYILALGTMQPRKNIPFLISAFAKLAKKIDDIQLVLVGKESHNYDNNIRQMIDTHSHIKDRIVFTGYVAEEDKYDVYKCAQVFVFPSLYEGFSIPILEAFEAGVPVVASDICPHREIGGEGALYCNPQNIDQCAKMLYDILVNDRMRNEILAVATKQKEKFSWRKSAENLQRLYESV